MSAWAGRSAATRTAAGRLCGAPLRIRHEDASIQVPVRSIAGHRMRQDTIGRLAVQAPYMDA